METFPYATYAESTLNPSLLNRHSALNMWGCKWIVILTGKMTICYLWHIPVSPERPTWNIDSHLPKKCLICASKVISVISLFSIFPQWAQFIFTMIYFFGQTNQCNIKYIIFFIKNWYSHLTKFYVEFCGFILLIKHANYLFKKYCSHRLTREGNKEGWCLCT